MKRWLYLMAALLALALVAAACGGDDSGGGTTAAPTQTTAATTPTTNAPTPTTQPVDDEPMVTSVPPPTPAIDIGAANPTQVVNDQASRATIEFTGDTAALVEGGAYVVDIQMGIEANSNSPGVSVSLVSIDGVITTTGITTGGDEFTPTWAWTPDGDKVVVTMVGRGVSVPDTRPSVVVTVQATADSDPVEFTLTAASG